MGKMGVTEMKSKEDFETAKNGDTLCVVDFFATWCGPCKMIAPKLEAMSKEMDGKVIFLKVDVDELEDLAAAQEVKAMPTFAFFKGGKKLESFAGANEARIRDTIEKLLGA